MRFRESLRLGATVAVSAAVTSTTMRYLSSETGDTLQDVSAASFSALLGITAGMLFCLFSEPRRPGRSVISQFVDGLYE